LLPSDNGQWTEEAEGRKQKAQQKKTGEVLGMTSPRWFSRCVWIIAAIALTSSPTVLTGCKSPGGNQQSASNAGSNTRSNAAQPGEAGVEKVKPAPGTGNVQGKVSYNSQPVENIEVRLCETFSRFLGGCDGQIYTARTDKDGEYVITNVTPKTYEALTARVFDTDSYVFATSGIAGISAAKYDVVADKTFFVTPINLFKSDLKTLNPKAGAKVSAQGLELKWEPYPDASYYKFSIFADDASVTSPYINERVEATSFGLDKPLQKGVYRWQVAAFNKDDRKLSESADDVKFTVNE
jgi:hypothetical protein